MVRIINNSNFQLHFDNGYILSVSCGYNPPTMENRAETVEVGIWTELEGKRFWKTHEFLDTNNNVGVGITVDELADIIKKVKEMEE